MKPTQVALYTRDSSDQQSKSNTIESQVADLRARITATGVTLSTELEFIDNGCEIWWQLAALINCMCIVLIDWHETTHIRC